MNSKAENLKAAALEKGDHSQLYTKNIDGQMYLVLASELESTNLEDSQSSTESDSEPLDPDAKITVALLDENGQEVEEVSFKNNVSPSQIPIPDLFKYLPATSEFISEHTYRISTLPFSTATATTSVETLTDSIKYLPVTSSGPNILSSSPHNTLIIKTSMPLSSLNLKSLIYSAGLAPKTQSEDTEKIPETIVVSKTIAPTHLSSYHNTQAFTSSTPTISLLSQKPLTATTNFITAPISSVNKINSSLSERSLLQCHSPSVNTNNSIPVSTDNKLTQALTLPVVTSASNQLVQSFPSSANVIKPINPANDTGQLIPKVQIANTDLVGAFMTLQSLASHVQCKSLPSGQVDEMASLSLSDNSNSLQMAPCLLISNTKADTSPSQLLTKKPTVHTSFVSHSLVSDINHAPSQNSIVSNVASPLLPLTSSVLAPMVQNNLQPTTALTSSMYKSLVCVNQMDSNVPSDSTVLATTTNASPSISSSYSVLALPQSSSSTVPLLVKLLPKTTPSATESILTLPSLGPISSVVQSRHSTICTTSMSNISNPPETNNTKDKFKQAQVYHNIINNSLPVTTIGNSPTYLAESKTAVPVNNPPKVNNVKTIRLMTPSDACSIFSPTTTTTTTNAETNISKANSLNSDMNVDLQKVTSVTMCQSSSSQQSPVIVLLKPLKSNSATVTPITIASVAPNVNLNSSMNGQVFALKANQEPNNSIKIDDTVQFLKLGSLANNETHIKVDLASNGVNTEVEAKDSNHPDNTSVLKIPANLMNDTNSKSFRLNPISNSSHYFKLADSNDNTTNIVKLNQTSPILNLNSSGNNSNLIKIPTTVINGRHIITLPNQAQVPSSSSVVPLSNQGSSSNSQLVTLPGKTTTAAPVLTFTSQAPTGSQVATLTSQASTGTQLVKLTSQSPTGTQLVTLNSQASTGTQLVKLTSQPPTGTQLVTLTSQALTGTQFVTLGSQAPTGTQVVKLASQAPTGTQLVTLASHTPTSTELVTITSQASRGTQLVTLASQAPTGTQLVKLATQIPTGTQLVPLAGQAQTGTQVVKLTSQAPTCTQLVTLASQAPTGSQLCKLTNQSPTGTQLITLASQAPTGTQLVTFTSQAPTGTQLVKLTSQPPTGTQLVKLTNQPSTGTQLVKLTSQPPTGTQLVKLTSQPPTGTQLVKLTNQPSTGTQLVKLTSQPPTGTQLVKMTSQAPTGTQLVKLTSQNPTGTQLVKLTSQNPTGTPLVKMTTQPPTGIPLVKLTNQPPTGTPLVKLTNQPPTGSPLVTLTGQTPTGTQLVKLTGQPPLGTQLVTLTSQSSTGAQLVSLPSQAQTSPVVTLTSQAPTNSQLVSLTSQASTGPQLVSLINQMPSNPQFLTVTLTNQGMPGAQVVKLPTQGFPGTHIIKLPTQVTPTINLPTQSLSSSQVVKLNSDNSASSNIKLMPLANSPVLQLNQPADLVTKSESSSINEQTLTTTSTNNPNYNSTASNAGINNILHKLEKGEACAVVVSRKAESSNTPTISTTAANSVHKLVSMQSLLKPKQTPVTLPSNSFLQQPFLSPKSSQKSTETQTKMEVVEDLPMTLKIDSIFSLKNEANKNFNYWEAASSAQCDDETDNQAESGCSSKVGSISENSSPPKYEKSVPYMKPLQIQPKVVLSSNIQNEKEKVDMKTETSTQCKPIVYARLNKPKLLPKTSPTPQKHYKLHDLSNHFSVSQRKRLVDIGRALRPEKMISVIKKAQKARPCQIKGRLCIEEVKKKKYAFLQPRVMLPQLYIPARMKSVHVSQLPSETKKSLKCNSNCIHRVRIAYPTPLLISPTSPPVLIGKCMIPQTGQHLMLVKMKGKNVLTPYLANTATTPNYILKDNSNVSVSMSSVSTQSLLLKQGMSLSSNVLTLPSATISRAPVSFGSVKSISPLKVCITPEKKESVQKNELSPNKDDTMNCLQLACGIIQDNTLKRKSSLSEDFDWRGEDKSDSDWSMDLEMQRLSHKSKKKKKINLVEAAL